MVVAELQDQDLQDAPNVCGAHTFEGIEQSPERGRTMLPWMLAETPADSDEIEEIQAIRLCDGILHRPGSQLR